MSDFWWSVVDTVQAVADGLLFGTTYALIGIGFTMIFGVMHKINLAYGAVSIGGAYTSLLIFQVVPAPPVLVYFIAAMATGVIGYLVYLCCFRFIPVTSPLAALMASVGGLLFIDEVVVHATDGMPQAYPAMFDDVMFFFGPDDAFGLRGDLIFVFGIGLISMVVLMYVLYRTHDDLIDQQVPWRR